jgi:hypothetical protein
MALHHRQLAIQVGEAGGTLVPWPGEGSRWLLREMHCTSNIVTKPPESFKGDREKRVSRAVVVHEIVPAPVDVLESSGKAVRVRSRANVRSGQGVDEGDVREHMAGSQAEVAVEFPACLGTVGGAGCNLGAPSLTSGGEAQAANEFSQHLRSVIIRLCTRPLSRLQTGPRDNQQTTPENTPERITTATKATRSTTKNETK